MGKILGFPKIIAKTHQMFDESLIYYNDRPDLMAALDNTSISNSTDAPFVGKYNMEGLKGYDKKGGVS
jgi:hypothetical protein